MKYIGYHRTSTTEQHLERGVEAITSFCREQGITLYKNKVYCDQKTGKTFDRPKYLLIKEELLEPGDVLIISELDRLGRTKEDTLRELRDMKENQVRVMILEIPTTLTDYTWMDNSLATMVLEAVNNTLIEMYATIAQAEMEKREKRQREGIEAMKQRGEWNRYGRPRKMDLSQFAEEYQKVEKGEMRPFALRDKLGMKTSTFYHYRKRYEKNKEAERRMAYMNKVKDEIADMKKENSELNHGQIEKVIAGIKASMAMEGFELTEGNIESAKMILSGEADAEELLDTIIEKYKKEK